MTKKIVVFRKTPDLLQTLSMGKKAGNFTMPPVVGAAAEPISDIQNKKEKAV
jgi:hypothetical protein